MFLKNKKFAGGLAVALIVAMTLQGCATLFPTQRMIDDILPNNDRHFYCDADLIPYSKQELTNATMLYGQELSEYYFMNLNKFDENVNDNIDEDAREEFMARLTYMNANYKLLKARYEKYTGEEGATKEEFEQVDTEFNDFYRLPNSKFAETVRENNANRLAGSPELSLRIKPDTFVDNTIYVEAVAEIYKHVTIPKKQYSKMKIGEKLTLEFPESNSDPLNPRTREVTLTLIATDSFIEYDTHPENDPKNFEKASASNVDIEEASDSELNENDINVAAAVGTRKSKDSIYYVTADDPLSKYRKLINADGEVIEIYKDDETIQIMKDARIAKGIDETRLVTQILREDEGTKNYTINQIADAAMGGGYIAEDFKDEVYLNNIYTNLKGYITSGYLYEQMYIDIEFAREHNTEYTTEKKAETNNVNESEINNGLPEGFSPEDFPEDFNSEDIDSENPDSQNLDSQDFSEETSEETIIETMSEEITRESVEETTIAEETIAEETSNEEIAQMQETLGDVSTR